MKNRIISITLAAIILVGGFFAYLYLTPVITYSISPVTAGEGVQWDTIEFTVTPKIGLPIPGHIKKELSKAEGQIEKDGERFKNEFKAPTKLSIKVRSTAVNTYVTYSGKYTDKDGESSTRVEKKDKKTGEVVISEKTGKPVMVTKKGFRHRFRLTTKSPEK